MYPVEVVVIVVAIPNYNIIKHVSCSVMYLLNPYLNTSSYVPTLPLYGLYGPDGEWVWSLWSSAPSRSSSLVVFVGLCSHYSIHSSSSFNFLLDRNVQFLSLTNHRLEHVHVKRWATYRRICPVLALISNKNFDWCYHSTTYFLREQMGSYIYITKNIDFCYI